LLVGFKKRPLVYGVNKEGRIVDLGVSGICSGLYTKDGVKLLNYIVVMKYMTVSCEYCILT